MSAAPQIKIELDQKSKSDFEAALSLYHKATKKEIPVVVNRAAVNLCFKAAKATKQADKQAIKSMQGIYNQVAWLEWNYKRLGREMPPHEDLVKAITKFASSRAASAGFIRRGWVRAAQKLMQKTGVRPTTATPAGGKNSPGKGTATPATQGNDNTAEVVNFATSKSSSSASALTKYGGTALQQAFQTVAADMRGHAEKLLAKQAQQFNKK